jgi:hypothetical protein
MVPTWGDPVKIKNDSPFGRAGEEGEVVGVGEIESERQSKEFGFPIGEPINTVEYGDGSSDVIPSRFLELIPYDYAKRIRTGDMVMVYPDSPFGGAGLTGKVIRIVSIASANDEQIFELPIGEPLYIIRFEEGRDVIMPLTWIERVRE